MSEYNIIISTSESTVVTEYEPQGKRSDAYQSEAALEKAFIQQICRFMILMHWLPIFVSSWKS